MTGLVLAGEVSLVKYDGEKKEVTVKEGDKEHTYKFADKVKVTMVIDKEGTTKQGTIEAATKILSNENFKGKKFEITTEKDTITEIKLKARRSGK
jgi:hypothetical protein